jgi:hypothetical protein
LGFDQDLGDFKVSTSPTRSRTYRKNDTRYGKQKNNSVVRKRWKRCPMSPFVGTARSAVWQDAPDPPWRTTERAPYREGEHRCEKPNLSGFFPFLHQRRRVVGVLCPFILEPHAPSCGGRRWVMPSKQTEKPGTKAIPLENSAERSQGFITNPLTEQTRNAVLVL